MVLQKGPESYQNNLLDLVCFSYLAIPIIPGQ